MSNPLEDLVMMTTLGMSKDEFMRTANLKRNPEGFGEQKRCPVCKRPVEVINEDGDIACENFSLDYEKNGKCYWHRWANGTNYWSSPKDVLEAAAKEFPEFGALYKEHFGG